ncbi:hypothetical protein WMF27_12555 [Sorangium sp. So ce281]|uniref:hypothetical protein n=1 Tax=unclassified Sorangium TaxID=2621164 RepID=UPI003F5E9473
MTTKKLALRFRVASSLMLFCVAAGAAVSAASCTVASPGDASDCAPGEAGCDSESHATDAFALEEELVCDNTSVCGDSTSGCVQCALAGNCSAALDACGVSDPCIFYLECTTVTCGLEPECVAECAETFPAGAALAHAVYSCVYCDECPNDCSGVGYACE